MAKLTPRDFAKEVGVAPQLVYYHIRQGHIEVVECECGRKVIDVEAAKAAFKEFGRGISE